MTDTDLTDSDIQDARIQQLVNSAVDRELAGSRTAPPWNPLLSTSQSSQRLPATHSVTRWSVPALAASVAAVLVAGTVLAINHDQDRRATPAAHSVSPTPSAAPSVSRSVEPDDEAAAREYAAAAATASDPSKLAGVTISPLSGAEADQLKGSGALRADNYSITTPQPGKTYSFTMSYLAGPTAETAVVSIELQDVASGSCPPPLLARAGSSYRIRCHVTFRADTLGVAKLRVLTPSGGSALQSNLLEPGANYDRAVADAPEAGTVAGVTQRPATTAERKRTADSVGSLTHPITDPKPGRSYPVTILYVPSSAAPAISVLAFRFEGVAAGSCPRAFRVRPAHAYQISCRVTFQPGVRAWVYYEVVGPQGVEPTGLGLF